MSVERSDLTEEEWEMLHRLNRGPPESRLVPQTILRRFLDLRLASQRPGGIRVSDEGKRLIRRHRDEDGTRRASAPAEE